MTVSLCASYGTNEFQHEVSSDHPVESELLAEQDPGQVGREKDCYKQDISVLIDQEIQEDRLNHRSPTLP